MTTTLDEILRQALRTVMEMGQAEVRRAARDGVSCEKWLHQALHERLTLAPDVEVAREEGQVDLTLRAPQNGETLVVEIKTFPTNYGQAGKPITQFIDSVINDLNKLRIKASEGTFGRVIWIAYPVPTEIPDQWINHLARVKRASTGTERLASISVGTDMKALAYISRP